MKRRRVLVLAYLFPPLGGAGVQRTLKFVRYLEPLGWDATVISTRSRRYPARDGSLLKEVPAGTRVVRTSELPLLRWASMVPYRLRLQRLYSLLTWPDGGSGWAPFAFSAALRAARKEEPDAIFSSSAPYSSHLVALAVARLTGTPWVADFRDEWAANPHRTEQPRVLRRLAETCRARHRSPCEPRGRCGGLLSARRPSCRRSTPHGDCQRRGRGRPASAGGPSSDRFVLAHVGTVYESIDPSPVLRALASLVERGEIDGDRVEVRLVGSNWLPDFSPPRGLRVEQTGYVEHARAVEEMCAATALLLYVPSSSLAPSGKLFEYLASGRPLLACVHPDNLAARLVREWDAGVVADPHDEQDIEQALLTLWRRWREDGLPDQEAIRRRTLEHYSRRRNAERLAELLDEAADG